MALFSATGTGAQGTGGGGSNPTGVDPLQGKSWTLTTLAGEDPGPGPAVTLRLEAGGTLGGFDGCNHYQGAYSAEGSNIRISPRMAMTMMACPGPIEDRARAYLRALEQVAMFAVEGNRLSLRDAAAVELAGFEAASLTLSGTSWEVRSYNNGKEAVVSLILGSRITASFGQDGRVTGSAGCNRYFAGFEAEDETLRIGTVGASRRLCRHPEGVMEQEARYLEALQSATSFRVEGDKMTLRTAQGATAVSLVRGPQSRPEEDVPSESKIRFDLDKLDPQGLQGPPEGLRALHYEYCIPDRPEAIRQMAAIDPTLEIQRGSPGRVGCGPGKLLCLGHTHQPGYREILERIAALGSVEEIQEAFFE